MKYRDDFKVKFTKKPDFTIDKENKTVKCYLSCDVMVPTGISGNQFMMNFRTFSKGYAKCDNKDTFNPEIGKKIALARAESKLYWKVRTAVKEARRDAKVFIGSADRFISKALRVIGHNEDYINKYCISKPEKNLKLSEKAKNQSRDELGRFTACTQNNNTCEKQQNKSCTCNQNNEIKITINRI